MRRLERIRIEIPNQVIRQFKKQAKDAFPRETFAYLIGRDAGTVVEIEGLFIPDGLDAHCTPASVVLQPHWRVEALEHAQEDGCEVVGDIHSHPFQFKSWCGTSPGRIQSEGDLDCTAGELSIYGIRSVGESKSGRIRPSHRFWGTNYSGAENKKKEK